MTRFQTRLRLRNLTATPSFLINSSISWLLRGTRSYIWPNRNTSTLGYDRCIRTSHPLIAISGQLTTSNRSSFHLLLHNLHYFTFSKFHLISSCGSSEFLNGISDMLFALLLCATSPRCRPYYPKAKNGPSRTIIESLTCSKRARTNAFLLSIFLSEVDEFGCVLFMTRHCYLMFQINKLREHPGCTWPRLTLSARHTGIYISILWSIAYIDEILRILCRRMHSW